MRTVSVMLIDSSTLFRQGFRHLLPRPEFEIVIEAARYQDALATLQQGVTVDLILFDAADLQTIVGGIRALREAAPSARIVHLANTLDADRIVGALEAGVDGFVSKDRSPEAVAQSLRLVMIGEKVLPPDVTEILLRRPEPVVGTRTPRGLSGRETQILEGLVKGHSNKKIAIDLDITEATVKVHLKSLLRKIGCSNRTQAAIWALNNGVGSDQRGTPVLAA